MSEVIYSIVVPCYGSGDWLEELVLRIKKTMENYQPFELILVNDRSPDQKTWNKINQLAQEHAFVTGIDLLYNVGQFKAILCGFEQAKGKFILTMDDDLQHPPEEIPKLIEAIDQNPLMDCIMGEYISKQHTPFRNAGSRFVKRIMNRLYNKPVDLVTTSFRIMPAAFAKSLLLYRIASPRLGPLIVSLSKKVMNIPVQHEPRRFGSSGYDLAYLIRETFQSIINASVAPLRIFTLIGFSTACFAFFIGLYYLIRWIFGGIGVAGFTSLILAISFFSGMMLAGIGILGEYIGRIIKELTGMPRYEIQNIVRYTNE